MKKIAKSYLAMILALIMLVSCITGCGQKEEPSSSQQTQTAEASASTKENEKEKEKETVNSEPIEISILTTRGTGVTTDVDKIWFFHYLEYWLAEQGYNVTINVQQTLDPGTQIPLLLGTDNLPDIIWGHELTPEQAVVYGEGEGMILDWTPYLNEEDMPNLYALINEGHTTWIDGSKLSNGSIYGLPQLSRRSYQEYTMSFGQAWRPYLNTSWLEECDLEVPTTMDEFIDMLRAFKNVKLDSGEEVIPLLSVYDFFEKFLWMSHGYYGSDWGGEKYGTGFVIKDGEVHLPAYTEDYESFIKIMKTCYDEGLISRDYFTMDDTRSEALMKSGVAGMNFAHSTDFGNFEEKGTPVVITDLIALPLLPVDDDTEVYISASHVYTANKVWASADTEHPEVVAKILDYLYSPEGAMYYYYGPIEGQDPLNENPGWYLKSFDATTGTIKTTWVALENGSYTGDSGLYTNDYVRPSNSMAMSWLAQRGVLEAYGLKDVATVSKTITDALTGEEITGAWKQKDATTTGGYWRITSTEGAEGLITAVMLPNAYLNEEDSLRASELKMILDSHITSESAKFITGKRPIDEIDDFMEELKKLEVEEYIELYRQGYQGYMDSIFK